MPVTYISGCQLEIPCVYILTKIHSLLSWSPNRLCLFPTLGIHLLPSTTSRLYFSLSFRNSFPRVWHLPCPSNLWECQFLWWLIWRLFLIDVVSLYTSIPHSLLVSKLLNSLDPTTSTPTLFHLLNLSPPPTLSSSVGNNLTKLAWLLGTKMGPSYVPI